MTATNDEPGHERPALTYVLDEDNSPVPERDLWKWCEFMLDIDGRRVARDSVGPCTLSTVFLGVDQEPFAERPVLWETMGFFADGGYKLLGRYCSHAEAVRRHEALAAEMRNGPDH